MTPEQFDALEIGQEVTLTVQTPIPSAGVLYVCEKTHHKSPRPAKNWETEVLWLFKVGDKYEFFWGPSSRVSPRYVPNATANLGIGDYFYQDVQCRVRKNRKGVIDIRFALWSDDAKKAISYPATLKHIKKGGTQ